MSSFKASPAFVEWLAAGSKPIYIGFGSMVIDDPQKLVDIIKVRGTSILKMMVLSWYYTVQSEL
jgi:hypothetical protein